MNTLTILYKSFILRLGSGGYVMPSEQKRSESLRPPSRVLRNASRHSGALRLCVIGKYLSKFSLRYISGRHQLGVTQELVLGQRDQRFHSVTGSVLTISSLGMICLLSTDFVD